MSYPYNSSGCTVAWPQPYTERIVQPVYIRDPDSSSAVAAYKEDIEQLRQELQAMKEGKMEKETRYTKRIIEKQTIEKVVVYQQPPTKEGSMKYTDFGFILAVILITTITVKVILPRMTLKNIVKALFRALIWPVTAAVKAVKKEADEEIKGHKE